MKQVPPSKEVQVKCVHLGVSKQVVLHLSAMTLTLDMSWLAKSQYGAQSFPFHKTGGADVVSAKMKGFAFSKSIFELE